MQKKLTISIDGDLYTALYRNVGAGKISRFIADSIKPRLKIVDSVRQGYRRMGRDSEWMKEAGTWVEDGVDEGLPEATETKWNR